MPTAKATAGAHAQQQKPTGSSAATRAAIRAIADSLDELEAIRGRLVTPDNGFAIDDDVAGRISVHLTSLEAELVGIFRPAVTATTAPAATPLDSKESWIVEALRTAGRGLSLEAIVAAAELDDAAPITSRTALHSKLRGLVQRKLVVVLPRRGGYALAGGDTSAA